MIRISPLAALSVCFASLALGCSSKDQPVVQTPNPSDLGGTGLSPQQQLDALEANTSMPPQLKARKIQMLKNRMAGTMGPPPGSQK